MKTKAVRLYGVNDLRLEEFELPELRDDEILARVVTDSVCMSTHKLAMQGTSHKRVRHDLAKEPVMVGHEFCGVIEKVGKKWQGRFKEGSKFAIQPALNYQGTLWAPGYSYQYIGGDATYVIIPPEVMEMNCLLDYQGDNFFMGSLAEPVSCIVGAFHAQYHTSPGSYVHEMGIKEGGSLALLAGVGPMGLGAIDYALHNPRKPRYIVVTDIDEARLSRAQELLSPAEAQRLGITLHYVNTRDLPDPVDHLVSLNGGKKFDDVFVFAPVRALVEMADRLLGHDGCLNFFAGPTDPAFSAQLNFYDVHYESHHLVGTSGGNTEDMIESLEMMSRGLLNPVFMITHVGGLNAVPDTVIHLDKIPGGKKLIYTHKKLDLVAITDFAERGKTDPFYAELARICAKHGNLWSREAEEYLLQHAPDI
ncbi:MAG TPA: zinc-binding dehydrogenase [Termitinemataceae bacterium]|uniref:zinc-binding dehydrogenase n=1 Tax=Treponema sp. J25 TaxID=2094121 RepID=UPI00104743CD|nr:zinc-binding dehydrogenase [Treponema sp. J25]TCW61122.1 L-sorbose 1-phosphate reductase [Treponema sp. J25]HOK00033.1 zinc-binding dehydrogenase [Termitinemataceae bacterium]HOM24247.1 zinc-binding dehydrogenase [Termitinemataceae bacterium]HPQ01328.1 zinc-binding dehydrogenase [Termitinemataceae bacterium]